MIQKKRQAWCCVVLALFGWQAGYGQSKDTLQLPMRVLSDARIETYKRVGETDLRLSIVYPPDYKAGQSYPAIVFFFGGGWVNGDIRQFEPQCHHFARRGMVAIAADYRVKGRHGTTPADAVRDGRSALRWLRGHARQVGIDPNRLVAAGGSAGGHVALGTALLSGFDDPADDPTVSSCPTALVLFNPVVKTTPGGFGYERMGTHARAEALSPVAHIRPGLPPTLILHGTADEAVPVGNVNEFCRQMQSMGNTCELHTFPDQKHGFFNYTRDRTLYEQTLWLADRFLVGLGYIAAKNKP